MAQPTKYQLRDWQQHNDRVIGTASQNREVSQSVRGAAASLTRDTTTQLQKTQREVQNRLTLRIDDIAQRDADLNLAISDTFTEIGMLQNHLDMVRSSRQAKDMPLEIVQSCLDWRKERVSIDVVRDDVERSLGAEQTLIEQIQNTLDRRADDCREQLRLLRAAHHQLEADERDKTAAVNIDRSCRSLDTTSHELGRHLGATSANPRSVEVADWDGYTGDNIQKSRQEIASSKALREALDAYLKESADALNQQCNATDDAFNVRLAETSDAKTLDEQNLSKTRGEISDQDLTIKGLNTTITDQNAPLAMAETRLSKRTYRPNVELVHDPVEDVLVKEAQDIESAVESLRVNLSEAEAAQRGLVRAENALIDDINTKMQSLSVDNRCMQRRQQFKYRTPVSPA